MLTFSQITLYYLLLLAYLLTIIIVGSAIVSSKNNRRSILNLFNALFAGVVSLVVVTALVVTKFQTVYTGIILLVLMLKWPLNLHGCIQNILENLQAKKLLFILLVGSLFFGFNLAFHRTIGDTKIPHEDYLFYSQLANNLFNGFEGVNYKLYATGLLTSKQLTPYHYFELWTAVPVIFVTKNAVWSLNLVAYSLLQTIAFFGLYAIVDNILPKSKWVIPTAILLFFIGGVQFNFMHQFIARNYTGFITDTALFSQFGRKYAIIFIAFYWAVLHFINGSNKKFLLGLGFAAFFYPTVTPGVLIFILAYLFFNYRQTLKQNINWLVPALVAIYPIIFYTIITILKSTDTAVGSGIIQNMALEFRYKSGIWFLIISALSLGIYFIPFAVVFKTLKNQYKWILIMTAIAVSIGFLISLVIPTHRDQIQFYTNTLPFLLILIQISIVLWIAKKPVSGGIFLVTLAGFTFFKNFEKQSSFNRTVSGVTTAVQKEVFDQLMRKHPKNCFYGYIWSQNKIEQLHKDSHLFLSANHGYIKIHGYLNAINLSNLPNEKKTIPYDEPFQIFSINKPYDVAYNQWLLSQKISFILNEQGEPIH